MRFDAEIDAQVDAANLLRLFAPTTVYKVSDLLKAPTLERSEASERTNTTLSGFCASTGSAMHAAFAIPWAIFPRIPNHPSLAFATSSSSCATLRAVLFLGGPAKPTIPIVMFTSHSNSTLDSVVAHDVRVREGWQWNTDCNDRAPHSQAPTLPTTQHRCTTVIIPRLALPN